MVGTRKTRVLIAKQIRMIKECHQNGITDANWWRENAIAVSTLYN